jgi:hypothetical protein
LKGERSRQPLLVNSKGEVVHEFDILNDGPDGIGSNGAWGYRFLGDDKILAQGMMNGYHLLDLEGKKVGHVPSNAENIYRFTIYKSRTTFHPFYKGNAPMIVGEEVNSFNPGELDFRKLGAEFYDKARVVFAYNLETRENQLLETFPEEWEPKASKRFVGESLPLVSFNKSKNEIAVLPTSGNQLFLYDYSGEEPVLNGVVELSHRHRPAQAVEVALDQENRISDYPNFSDVRHAGEYILVMFSTKIPSDVMRGLMAQDEQYTKLPEYQEARKNYVKPYFLVIKDGKQIGSISEVPVKANFNFADESGNLYFNGSGNPDVEKDYNVFYKLQIKE